MGTHSGGSESEFKELDKTLGRTVGFMA
jgi:hypothetical protein